MSVCDECKTLTDVFFVPIGKFNPRLRYYKCKCGQTFRIEEVK